MSRDNAECWHDYGGVKLMPMHFGGHAYLVRKCETAVDIIELPDSVKDRSQWVEVLAVGPRVGQMCSKRHAETYRKEWVEKYGLGLARRSVVTEGLQGAMALVSVDDDPRIWNTGIGSKEYFIEESLPVAIKIVETQDEEVGYA